MVTIRFRSFTEFKDYIQALGKGNPNIAAPNRFHTVRTLDGTIAKMAQIYAGGQITFLYTSPVSETIPADDPWLQGSKEMEYPASVLVADIGESIT
jgi:hypothetical protein